MRYTYDKKNRLVEIETTGSFVDLDPGSESHITGKVVYVYKDKDHPKEMLIYNQNGSLRERVLIDYDSRGNWIKRTHQVKTQPANNSAGLVVTSRIEYRTITYQ